MWWINQQGGLYIGECAAGDRAATAGEIAAWEAVRTAPPAPTLAELQAQVDALQVQIDALVAATP